MGKRPRRRLAARAPDNSHGVCHTRSEVQGRKDVFIEGAPAVATASAPEPRVFTTRDLDALRLTLLGVLFGLAFTVGLGLALSPTWLRVLGGVATFAMFGVAFRWQRTRKLLLGLADFFIGHEGS